MRFSTEPFASTLWAFNGGGAEETWGAGGTLRSIIIRLRSPSEGVPR